MCRIFGLLDLDQGRDALSRRGDELIQLLRHGGPDDQAHRATDGVLIGGTRLAISDPVSGSQPFTADGVTVFYNGEIYNAPELRRQLQREGVTFDSECDGEVLPPLFARHGVAAAELLDGMFAIAAYDQREQRLLLARDRAGIKPLYVFAEGRRFGFASEIPALVRLRGGPVTIDPDALDRYLRFKAVYGAVPEPGSLGDLTMIEGIRALPPGHTLQLRLGHPPVVTRLADITEATSPEADPVGAVGDALEGLIGEMLPADVPFCVALSGGLDSTIVTTLAARAAGPLHAFTVVPRNPSVHDEAAFAELAAEAAGARLERVAVGGADIPRLLPTVVRSLGQPNSDPITVSTYSLFQAIRAAGFPVALTGDGSDELFGGYDRFRAIAQDGDIGAYQAALAAVPADLRASLYTDDLSATLRDRTWADDGPPGLQPGLPGRRALTEEVTAFELRHRLPVYHLQRLDHLSSAHAVEARVPFCRPRMVAIGRSLRLADKVADGAVKVTLSAAALRFGWAPEEIIRRPKQPFTFRLSEHLLEDGGIGLEWARQVLTDPSARRGYFEITQVEKLLTRLPEQRDESVAHAIWALLVLELWLRQMSGDMS